MQLDKTGGYTDGTGGWGGDSGAGFLGEQSPHSQLVALAARALDHPGMVPLPREAQPARQVVPER